MSKRNLMNTYARFDAVFVEGRGAKLIDISRLDWFCPALPCTLGHSILSPAPSRAEPRLMHVSTIGRPSK